jgi:competence protein ComEC
MSKVHFLNVGQGDCTLLQHNSGRNSLVDICKGNYQPLLASARFLEAFDKAAGRVLGDFGMSKKPTNPISYLSGLGVTSLFRFILTHPDMDHLDGFDALMNKFTVTNFWDSQVRREKPDFAECRQYKEEDWDRYAKVYAGNEPGITLVRRLSGSRFAYANNDPKGANDQDGLYILAPDAALVADANKNGDLNDASFVLLYRSAGGRIVIPGDAHDETWAYVLKHYKSDVANCSVFFAPHHGRKSGRDFSFLDVLKPKITFFGCANSGDLAYSAWRNRGLRVITNNQAGNIVLDCRDNKIHFFVENEEYAKANDCDTTITNEQGYVYYDTIPSTPEVAAAA